MAQSLFEQFQKTSADSIGAPINNNSPFGAVPPGTVPNPNQPQGMNAIAHSGFIFPEKGTAEYSAALRELQTDVHRRLVKMLSDKLSKGTSSKDETFLKVSLQQIFYEIGLDSTSEEAQIISKNVINVIRGLGPLDALLKDPQVTEIICCGYNNIWTERDGRMGQEVGLSFSSEEEFRNVIDSKILQPIGRRIDDSQPMVNARLADKSRVNVVINPISAGGATLDIRKFREGGFTIDDYLQRGSMVKKMAELIRCIVLYRKCMVISGGTGSGKTTLMNCFCSFIPPDEAIITLEDTLELQLKQPCLRSLEARAANSEGTGGVTIRDLLVNCLRMRPDRIIVGECRSGEIVDMLQAANTGHDGTVTSVHANNPQDAIDRMVNMYMFAGIGDIPEKAIKGQIASAVNVFVQVKRMDDGSRKVVSITEVIGYGKSGIEKNNEYVETHNLDEKFMVKSNGNAVNNVILQDIYYYDEMTNKYMATGWVPTFWDLFMKKSNYTLADAAEMFTEGEI